jgi:hypothetical protein
VSLLVGDSRELRPQTTYKNATSPPNSDDSQPQARPSALCNSQRLYLYYYYYNKVVIFLCSSLGVEIHTF